MFLEPLAFVKSQSPSQLAERFLQKLTLKFDGDTVAVIIVAGDSVIALELR